MMDQHSFSFGSLPKEVLSDPRDQEMSVGRAHIEGIFRNDIKSVFLLLNKEVRTGCRRGKPTHRGDIMAQLELANA